MQEELFQDSPFFREDLKHLEVSVGQFQQFLTNIRNEAFSVHTKGKDYCSAMEGLLNTVDSEAVGVYRPALAEIKENLQAILACQESFLLSLENLLVK